MFLLAAFLLLILLPEPWNLVLGLAGFLLFVGEVVFWQRRVRNLRVRTGAEDLVGSVGVVTTPLAPVGQIRVKGELWEARSAETRLTGERVRVTAIRDLTLDVEPETGGSGSGRVAAGVGAVAVVVFALAACGGDDGSSASEDYANSVCSDLSTWITDVQATTKSLTDAGLSISKDDVENAVGDIEKDTNTLVDELKQEGPPDTEDGQQAQTDLENLTNELQTQVNNVKQAADSNSGPAVLASAVLTAVSNGANALKSTYESLQGLDPAGELKDAFENSDDCKSLKDQVNDIGS